MQKSFPAVFLLICLAVSCPVMAQTASTSCEVGVVAPPFGFWTWAPRSKIKVYVLAGDFEKSEISFLLSPLGAWNAVSETTGSGVKFEYSGETGAPLYCEHCLTVMRGPVFDKSKRRLTELRTFSAQRNRIMFWAIIVVDPLLTKPETLTNAVAHELGHNFGLLDCYSCKPKSTVMNQFKSVNSSNQMVGPTACDVAQVRAAYLALATQTRRSALAKKIVVVDEGEEPIDDDTPVVVPQP